MSPAEKTSELYLGHRDALLNYATRITGSREAAEDIVQEAYLRFVRPDSDRPPAPVAQPLGYLYRVVRNLAVDAGRRLSLMRRQVRDASRAPELAPSPEDQILFRDELRVVAEALSELPARTRRVFELHRLAGFTLEQIARELDISVTLAHQLVRKALTHCADRLDGPDTPK